MEFAAHFHQATTQQPQDADTLYGDLIVPNPRQDVVNVGLVKQRKCEVLLAEVVQGCAYMDKNRLVDDEEAVVELI